MYTVDSSGLEQLRVCSPVLCNADMPAVCPWALTQLSSLSDGGDIGVRVLRCGWHRCGFLAALLTALQRAIRTPWTEQIVSFCPDMRSHSTRTPVPHTLSRSLLFSQTHSNDTQTHMHRHTGLLKAVCDLKCNVFTTGQIWLQMLQFAVVERSSRFLIFLGDPEFS